MIQLRGIISGVIAVRSTRPRSSTDQSRPVLRVRLEVQFLSRAQED